MNKIKVRKLTLFALVALFALALSIAVGALMPVRVHATGSDNNPFDSSIVGYKKSASDENGYLTLIFDNNTQTREYQRKLALKWYEGLAEGETAPEGDTRKNPGKACYFSMTFSLPEVNFAKLTFTFSGTEENVTKDALSVNDLVFVPDGDALKAYIVDASMQADKDKEDFKVPEGIAVDATNGVKISIDETGCAAGEFNLYINGESAGKLTNIGGNFLDYSSSSSAKKKPLVIKTELAEGKEKQKLIVGQISGQTFELSGATDGTAEADGTIPVTGGRITDNAPAVLVLNQKVYGFTLGQRFALDYETIDVCDNSVSPDRTYYMLAYDADGNPVSPTEDSTDDYKTLNTSTYFLPKDSAEAKSEEQYVSIRFALTDNKGKGEFIYLSWYADTEGDTLASDFEGDIDYIRVRLPEEYVAAEDGTSRAPGYKVLTASVGGNEQTQDYQALIDAYQSKVTEAAEAVSAGDGSYYYLPSMRDLVKSDYADYTDLRFSIYYYKPGQAESATASSQTSLRYNNLKFEVDKVGRYRFRVLLLDKSGNAMKLFYDGKVTAVNSTNIWEIENFPEFSFEVQYNGLTIEDPGEQKANRGASYTIKDFTIVSLGDLDKTYKLYRVLPDKVSGTYAEFIDKLDKDYFDSLVAEDALDTISVFNDEIAEDDEKWKDTYNDYHWNPGSTPGSFVPMEEGIYIVELTVSDPNRAGATDYGYMAINVTTPTDYSPAQIDWLQNNMTSVILFAIAAVLAVFILVIFFVKPPEKEVEDVDLDKLKGSKNDKKNKKN